VTSDKKLIDFALRYAEAWCSQDYERQLKQGVK
jgi:hypothetical protein